MKNRFFQGPKREKSIFSSTKILPTIFFKHQNAISGTEFAHACKFRARKHPIFWIQKIERGSNFLDPNSIFWIQKIGSKKLNIQEIESRMQNFESTEPPRISYHFHPIFSYKSNTPIFLTQLFSCHQGSLSHYFLSSLTPILTISFSFSYHPS